MTKMISLENNSVDLIVAALTTLHINQSFSAEDKVLFYYVYFPAVNEMAFRIFPRKADDTI